MTRDLYLMLSCAFAASAIALWLLLASQLRRLAQEVDSIASRADLDRVKLVVKTQMIAVLVLFPVAIAPIVLWMWMVAIKEAIPIWDHLFVILYAAFFKLGTPNVKRVEEKLRELPVGSPWLEQEYKDVVHAWRHKAFPDW